MDKLNAREELEAAMNWLSYQHEDLSYGIKSAEDAIKLWRAWTADPTLPEFCDAPEDTTEEKRIDRIVKRTLGYCPWKRCAALANAL